MMLTRNLAIPLTLFATLLLLAGCEVTDKETDTRITKILVSCGSAIDGKGVLCTVESAGDIAAGLVCWDVIFECTNGMKVEGSACQEISSGRQTSHKLIPLSDLTNLQSCDTVISGKVANTTYR